MARGRRRQERRTDEQRREVVRQFEASDLGAREFCRREGLALSSLQRWRARGRAAAARFVELAPGAAVTAPTGWAFELELPDGIRVRLRG
jgi:hypothetical protein